MAYTDKLYDSMAKMESLDKRMAEIYAILQDSSTDKDIQALLLEAGNMFSEAECILAKNRGRTLEELLTMKPTMPANEQKVLVEARCADLQKVVRKLEQATRALGIILATKRN